ncbi:hypothetical protein ANO14919_001800 [Xylariales sp. No.14919]|nr:hypothetical protein F5X98DRAFT_337680 [Xylaria grammica]GAW10845.1 hypothetical protein ANO14919_001800 [Xylariales sp. No.14919]
MSFTNVFWGSSGIDTLHCRNTPTSQGLLHDHPEWDGIFDLKETIDSKSVLELLNRPMPCSSAPQDEWLAEFERLQDVHSRAPAAQTIPASPHHDHGPFVAAETCTKHGADIGPHQRGSSPPLCQTCDTFLNHSGPACVHDEADCPTPTGTRCPDMADDQHPFPVTYTTVLYGWNETAACGNQQNPDIDNIAKTMLELRHMEQDLQADTKRRMSQVEESRRE